MPDILHVLHVEDEEGTCNALRDFLEFRDRERRIKLRVEQSVMGVLRVLSDIETPFHVVILDGTVHGGHTLQLITPLRVACPLARIIATSGDYDMQKKLLAAGADVGYLKPWNMRAPKNPVTELIELAYAS